MMNYEIFKEVVAEKLKDYLTEEAKGMEISVREVQKVNCRLDGLNLIGKEQGGVALTVYVNDMYEQYAGGESLEAVLSEAAKRMEDVMRDKGEIQDKVDYENAKDNIVFQLVNTDQNRTMLENMPHREIQDLTIIYRWIVQLDDDGIQSTMVENKLAERLGLNEEALFKAAVENTRRILPPTVKSMNDVIRDLFLKDGMPPEMADMMAEEMPLDQTMWIISNERGINGASSILYEDKLFELASELETDLYIMPSSVHEVIAISAGTRDPEELAQMVAEINMDQVAIDERLSNQVYHYDKDLRKLSLATDTPNKRLDGMATEPKFINDSNEKAR